MNDKPLVSVIMSVYNGEKYLAESISSVLNQTYSNLEFIIINDGSTDKTAEIIRSFSDPRVIAINGQNKGLTKSLNEALQIAKGEFIARMDADDVSEPNRFESQVDFLLNNPDIALCGTWAKFINENNEVAGDYKRPVEHGGIKKMIFWHNPFIHPSVMFRKKIIAEVGGYDERFRYAQDYELWTRVVPKFKTANIPEYLLRYRIMKGGITKSKNSKVRLLGLKIRMLALKRLYFS